jgi:hypothetical protein
MTGATKTEIANVALLLLGQPRIIALDQDTKAARALDSVWNVARRATLRGHPWNFAMSEAQLTAMVVPTGKMWKWGYAHPVPTDFLRLVDVQGLDGCYERKRIAGKQVICADTTPLNISYVADIDAEAELDPMFVLAFGKQLAELACTAITGSETALENIDALYRKMISAARGVDAQENGADSIEADGPGSWNAARL